MVKIMIGSIWREHILRVAYMTTQSSVLASFYNMKNTFGPNAGMQTNEFSKLVTAPCS